MFSVTFTPLSRERNMLIHINWKTQAKCILSNTWFKAQSNVIRTWLSMIQCLLPHWLFWDSRLCFLALPSSHHHCSFESINGGITVIKRVTHLTGYARITGLEPGVDNSPTQTAWTQSADGFLQRNQNAVTKTKGEGQWEGQSPKYSPKKIFTTKRKGPCIWIPEKSWRVGIIYSYVKAHAITLAHCKIFGKSLTSSLPGLLIKCETWNKGT